MKSKYPFPHQFGTFVEVTICNGAFSLVVRDYAQNSTNHAISLTVYNVIPLLIGQPT